ncbi:glycoside hydrolase family 3 protein [Mucilaginibacter sp. L3T2-6]|uniref:glycoside hydrolase family 3 protein n=1 Tax=Mucilaginibacter sp. L3T2-6 TaxID=3062491 RepID=UPI0026750622|nr:glycoside hydrolase family 3 N-terminal domain-containing protein [Mucilaginibacter sp. L3T2-6]MDO3640681.1 glycoside hydrolase family 3 N-terminal domain-containing protein [Mucilaginibacter sp. L3T2-6]MDV6212979.1 glycoside hydrolase family 3 N-terminal domain-containing protein [Mucilaginibacter sp. L3T2-6]
MLLTVKRLKFLLLSIACLLSANVFAQSENYVKMLDSQNHWVDSVFKKLSRKRKIAQLLFVRAHTNLGKAYEDSVAKVIKKEQLGGVVLFQGGPVRHAQLINNYQKLVKVPLLVAMDGEWGLGMRIDSAVSYPYQMTLGAIQDNNLIYEMGKMVAYDFKRLGLQMNLGPDMDINNNPDNPVINYRSFGDNKYNVAAKGIAYFKGMQDAGLLTTAKHFPGHGDTNVDSHLDLPLLPFTKERLDSLEEYPFKQAINEGISGVMIAHMDIPALDTTKNLPSTLSRPIVTGLLKDSLRFKGLVVSDAMEMKGVTKYFPDGEADVRAFLAGMDIIELSENSKRAIKKIRKAIRKGRISKGEFNAKVKKVLTAKYWAGLSNYHETNTANLVADINRPAAAELNQQLSDAAITLLKGDGATLQMTPVYKTAILSIGVTQPTVFQQELSKLYSFNKTFNVTKNAPPAELKTLLAELQDYEQVYVSINDSRLRPASKLDYTPAVKQFISDLAGHRNTVISVFANAYTLADLPGIEKCSGLLVAYQMTDYLQRSAVKVITRQITPSGRLPVTINKDFTTGMRIAL